MEESTRKFKVGIISRETIKACAPPSDHQRTFKISFLDQIIPPRYVRVIIFFRGTIPPPPLSGGGNAEKVDERSKKLKSWLSETLNRFYPVVGRLADNLCFSCNDEGVEYLEAQVAPKWSLSDILKKPNLDHLSHLLPVVAEESSLDISMCPMCLVQVSFFGCGGMAIAIRICHTISDAATLASLIMGWANTSVRGGNLDPVIPHFDVSDLFPPIEVIPNSASQLVLPLEEKWHDNVRGSRFHFGKSELASLQAKASSKNIPRPTRVKAVISLLWWTSLLAKREPEPSVLMCAVNLRLRLEPPLSEHSFGNLLSGAVIQCESTEDIPRMVDEFRRQRIDMCSKMVKELDQGFWRPDSNVGELFSQSREGAIVLFKVTSWCKFPFYEADFGWGKLVWVASGCSHQSENVFVLMDIRDGQGIEALVYLREEEIDLVKSNREQVDLIQMCLQNQPMQMILEN